MLGALPGASAAWMQWNSRGELFRQSAREPIERGHGVPHTGVGRAGLPQLSLHFVERRVVESSSNVCNVNQFSFLVIQRCHK